MHISPTFRAGRPLDSNYTSWSVRHLASDEVGEDFLETARHDVLRGGGRTVVDSESISSSGRHRFPMKPRPILRQVPPQLAHTCSAEPEPLRRLVWPLANHQLLRQPPIADG